MIFRPLLYLSILLSVSCSAPNSQAAASLFVDLSSTVGSEDKLTLISDTAHYVVLRVEAPDAVAHDYRCIVVRKNDGKVAFEVSALQDLSPKSFLTYNVFEADDGSVVFWGDEFVPLPEEKHKYIEEFGEVYDGDYLSTWVKVDRHGAALEHAQLEMLGRSMFLVFVNFSADGNTAVFSPRGKNPEYSVGSFSSDGSMKSLRTMDAQRLSGDTKARLLYYTSSKSIFRSSNNILSVVTKGEALSFPLPDNLAKSNIRIVHIDECNNIVFKVYFKTEYRYYFCSASEKKCSLLKKVPTRRVSDEFSEWSQYWDENLFLGLISENSKCQTLKALIMKDSKLFVLDVNTKNTSKKKYSD